MNMDSRKALELLTKALEGREVTIKIVVDGTEINLDASENVENMDVEVKQDLDQNGLERQITDLLRNIGVPANILGYQYAREAILMCVKPIGKTIMITKEVYPAIAEKYHTIPHRVERAIRHAIGIAWSKGSKETLNEIFGCTIDPNKRPTNAEFIKSIADMIRMQRRA